MIHTITPTRDKQTVTPDGELTRPYIDGLTIRPMTPIEDARGEIVEMYRPTWNIHLDPLVYVYQVSIRPGAIKGWVVHSDQDDRIYTCRGTMHWAFFDNRADSPTYQILNVFTFSERKRVLFIIPKGVFHAVKNIGGTEAIFINMPNKPYDHANPDKYRLPVKNELIPYDFSDTVVS